MISPKDVQCATSLFNQKNQIAPTDRCKAQLIKSKNWQIYCLERYHAISMWGIVSVYSPLTAPNLTVFTLYQCIMSIKSITNLHSFLGINTQEDGTLIVICDKSIQEKAKAFLSHIAIYLELIFGSVVWEAFTNEYRSSMANFQYCPVKNVPSRLQLSMPLLYHPWLLQIIPPPTLNHSFLVSNWPKTSMTSPTI